MGLKLNKIATEKTEKNNLTSRFNFRAEWFKQKKNVKAYNFHAFSIKFWRRKNKWYLEVGVIRQGMIHTLNVWIANVFSFLFGIRNRYVNSMICASQLKNSKGESPRKKWPKIIRFFSLQFQNEKKIHPCVAYCRQCHFTNFVFLLCFKSNFLVVYQKEKRSLFGFFSYFWRMMWSGKKKRKDSLTLPVMEKNKPADEVRENQWHHRAVFGVKQIFFFFFQNNNNKTKQKS